MNSESLIPLAVELVKKADISALNFSQAFENIYSTLECLRDEEEGKTRIVPSTPTENGQVKKRKARKITCKICGKKLRSLAGKHLRTHGLTSKSYHEAEILLTVAHEKEGVIARS